MPFVKVICPSCGGEVQMDDSLQSGFCVYCGTKIVRAVDSEANLRNALELAKKAISEGNYEGATVFVDQALVIDPECPDAWYMKALLNIRDRKLFTEYTDRGLNSSSNSRAVFTKEEIEKYRPFSVQIRYKKSLFWKDFVNISIDGQGISEIRSIEPAIFYLSKGIHKFNISVINMNGMYTSNKVFEFFIEKDTSFNVYLSFNFLKMKEAK